MPPTPETLPPSKSAQPPAVTGVAPVVGKGSWPESLAHLTRIVAESDGSLKVLWEMAALVAGTLGADHFGVAADPERTGQPMFWLRPTRAAGTAGTGPAGTLLGDDRTSAMAYALSVGHLVLSCPLRDETRFDDAVLRREGISSGVIQPLNLSTGGRSAIAAFHSRPRSFSEEEAQFVELAGLLAGSSLARRDAEAQLDHERRLRSVLLDAVDTVILEMDPDGRVASLNRSGQELTGFNPSDLAGRTIWDLLLSQEDQDAVRSVFKRLELGVTPIRFRCGLTAKDGRRCDVAWQVTVAYDDRGRMRSVLAAGQPGDGAAQSSGAHRPNDYETEAEARNRRTAPRKAFPYLQQIAPLDDGRLPGRNEFREVLCQDIAAGGFSFLSPVEPRFARLVVGFGEPPALTYLVAEVRYVRPVKREGEKQYQVGCRYVSRAPYPLGAPTAQR